MAAIKTSVVQLNANEEKKVVLDEGYVFNSITNGGTQPLYLSVQKGVTYSDYKNYSVNVGEAMFFYGVNIGEVYMKTEEAANVTIAYEKVEDANAVIQDERQYFKAVVFENVAEMKASNRLTIGGVVICKGYYVANDGGYSEYQIVDDDTLVDDGGSVHDVGAGLKAKLILKNGINVEQFGAKPGEEDCSTRLQAAFDYCSKNHIRCFAQSNKTFSVGKKIVIKSYFDLDFNNSVIKAIAEFDTLLEINCETKDSLTCGNIDDIILNGDSKVDTCLLHTCGKEGIINNVRVLNAKGSGYKIVTKGRAPRYVTNYHAESCAIGITIEADDIMFSNLFMKFCNKAVQNFGGSNFFENVHAWINNVNDDYATSTFFELSTTTFVKNCYSDTYKYSFRFKKNYINLFVQNLEILWNTSLVPSVKTDLPVIVDYGYELTEGQSDEASVNFVCCDIYSSDFIPKMVNDVYFAKPSLDFELKNCKLGNTSNVPKGFYTSISARNKWVLGESLAVMKDRRVSFKCKFNVASDTTIGWGSENWVAKLDRQEFYPKSNVNVICSYGKSETEINGQLFAKIGTDGFLNMTLPAVQDANMKYFSVITEYDI